jgi:site-specific DNA recombinase
MVALYARVSSEQQSKRGTIDSQIAALKERIQADGAQIVEDMCFVDAGVSGATLVRPQLERLRDAAALGAIDRLYILSPDRLARKYAYQALLMEELGSYGVQVVFLNHAIGTTPEESLLLQMQGMISDDAERGIMQSHAAKVAAQLASQQHNAVHYPGSNNEAISASGALNRPRRKPSGNTLSIASSFSDGSTRR